MNITVPIIVIFALVFYLLPSVIASTRKVEHSGTILLVNVLFGWTVLGWIAALIWAVVEKQQQLEPSEPESREQVTLNSDGTVKRAAQNAVLIVAAALMRLMKFFGT